MRKRRFVTMLSLLTTFMAASLLCNKMVSTPVEAVSDVTAVPITVQMRSGGSGFNYLVVLDENISAYDTPIGISNFSNYNAPSYINIYTSKNSEPIPLSDIIASGEWKINQWQSRGVMFPISDINYQTYNGATVYAIEILEGCTYPSTSLQRLVVNKTKMYINQNYGDQSHINEAFDWAEKVIYERSDQVIDLDGAQLRADVDAELFYFCLRSSVYFEQAYIEYADIDVLNAFDKVKLYLSSEDEGKTLREVTSTYQGCQNKWTSTCFHFRFSSDEYAQYNGSSVYKISVEQGTELILNNKIVTVRQNYTFRNEHYHDDDYKYGSFEFVPILEPGDQTIDLFGAEVRADPDGDLYFIDVKSAIYLDTTEIEYPDVDNYINAYDNIIVYLSEEDEGHTLGEITSLRNSVQNKWNSQAFMFYLTADEYETYNGTNVYRIKVLEGCELIFGNKICKVTRGIDLLNTEYGSASARNGAFNFVPYVPPIKEPISLKGAQVRGDADGELFYIDVISDAYFLVDEAEFPNLDNINAYDNIKIFLSEDDEGTLLRDVTSLRRGAQNRWESSAFLFALTTSEYEIYNGTTIYAIEVNKGTELLVGGAKAVIDKNYRFVNADYGKASAKYEAFNFRLEAGDLKEFGNIAMMNIHNRMDKDSGHRWIMFLFEENIYNVNMNVSNWINQLNFLDNVLIYFAPNSEPVLLRTIYNAEEEGVTLRMFGELNMLGVSIFNTKENDEYLYSGNKMYMIQINAGTQIPSYEDGETGYRIVNEKTVIKNEEYGMTGEIPNSMDDYGRPRLYEEWNLNWSVIHCYVTFQVIGIEGLSFPDMSLTPGERVSLDIFKQDGYDLTVTTTAGEKVYRYIIGSHHNIDIILTYTPASEGEGDKKGCQSEIVSSAIIVPIIASSLLAVLLILRKKGAHYEK